MTSSDGWHSVSSEKDELFNENKTKKIRVSHNKIRIALFIKLLKILKAIVARMKYVPTETNKFLEYRRLCASESDKIFIFKKLVFLGIPCKLYVIINDELEFALEVFMMEIIEKFKLSKTGLIFYIGVDGSLVNTTLLNSTKFKYFSIFASLIFEMKDILYDHSFFRESRKRLIEQGVTLPMNFNENAIFSAIPRSLKNMKYHPLYVIESIIKKNQIIFPKRPILGYFKGEPIFCRKNIQTLRSEKEWFKLGKKVVKPIYKLVDGVKLYRKYDVEDLIIMDLEDKPMLYYHDNHVPKNCVYSKNELSVLVARLLDIRYSECIVGFRYKMPIFQGIFLLKEDALLFLIH
ncbi:Nucleotide excision repair complex XPC-HR23B, subunit XPC/DPB11 [Trachipleistophora hominis]|uniref:Nucleotide excision repair complex XPC-HR23B, subunit XPC/DPB11 n=1 Tax=Trachipleistophora hominis TaxID=72359 RepID=L7JUJ0_TRAHO|nr:Nucleotide excision repair complex XPC-HR23B, subunit XPC/DPB11 [Trachipleistophora hominis]